MYRILMNSGSFKRIAFLSLITVFIITCSVPSFAHKGVVVNTTQNVVVQPTSIKLTHIIDCGTKSSLNILPLLDADKNGEVEEGEVNALADQIKAKVIELKSRYKAIVDNQTVFIPFQKLAVHYDQSGNNTTVEITFLHEQLSFKEGRHHLMLEREGYYMDISILMAMLGYPDTPQQGHSVPAHTVKMSLRFPENFTILNFNLGFTSPDSPSLLKGIFLTQQQTEVKVEFEAKPAGSAVK